LFYYPSDAPCTILFCKLCAVVTSWLTTNACTGACCPNACASWLVPLVPNMSNDGVCAGVDGAAAEEGVVTVLLTAPTSALGVIDFIDFTAPKPVANTPAILDIFCIVPNGSGIVVSFDKTSVTPK